MIFVDIKFKKKQKFNDGLFNIIKISNDKGSSNNLAKTRYITIIINIVCTL